MQREPSTALLILWNAGEALNDGAEKRTVRSFAPIAAKLLSVQGLRANVEQRSKDVIGNLRSSMESTERLSHAQNRRPLRFGNVSIEPQRELVRLGTQRINLSKTEFDLLYALATNPGAVSNAETLLREVWGVPTTFPRESP